MATLQEDITKANAAQMRTYTDDMTKYVRVTLLEPYGPDGILTVAFGYSEPQVYENPKSQDSDGGWDIKAPPRIVPGRPIHYHASVPDQVTKCPCIQRCDYDDLMIESVVNMPMPVAKIWFGNWDVFDTVYDPRNPVETRMTAPFEAKRVAHMWGGWKTRRRRGADDSYKTLTRVAPPAVPKVSIERLDTQFRRIPNSTFEPWKRFDFMENVFPDEADAQEAPRPSIVPVTVDQMNALVQAAVAEALKSKKAGSPSQT
jgi:hypothetical protein